MTYIFLWWGLIALGVLLLIIIFYLLQAVAYRKIFFKAGEKASWKAFVPVFNTYTQYSLTWNTLWFWVGAACFILNVMFAGLHGVLVLLKILVSLAFLVIRALNSYNLSLAFGHDIAYAFGLFFLGPIFMLIIGFDASSYQGQQDAVPLMDYIQKLEHSLKK